MCMAKSLGQIHTCNWTLQDIKAATNVGGTPTNQAILDISSRLQDQLQTMVHTMNNFKVCGINMTLEDYGTSEGGGQISGRLEYYSPTRGRCMALKNAWDFQRNQLKQSGIPYGKNSNYDFKPLMYGNNAYSGIIGGQVGAPAPTDSDVPNVAYSTNNAGQAMTYSLARGGASNQNIFAVWNDSLNPSGQASGDVFSPGFARPDVASGEDFVLFDEQVIYAPRNWADDSVQWIPFQMSWDPSDSDISVSFDWQPDPALYLSVLCGQFTLVIEEIEFDGDVDALTIRVAIHVAGWKSAISSPKSRRKSRRTKKTPKSSKGRRRS